MVDSQLHHSQEQLSRVVAKLKTILTQLILERRASAAKARSEQSRTNSRIGSRERISRLPSRDDALSFNLAREIDIRINNEKDAFLNSMNLSRQSICSPASFLSGSTIRPSTANSQSPLEHGSEGWVPHNILNRISLKVHESWKNRPATCQPSGFDHGHDRSTRRARSSSQNHVDSPSEILDINFLKLKIHELKTAEALAMRKSSNYSPKRLLSEYSPYGIRVNRNWKPLKPLSNDATRELVTLIDRIDQQLSSNEALSTLKELGIDYQPRSAFGKKNMMASDFYMALAPNGLKLNDGTPSSPSKEETNRTLDSIAS